VEADLPCAQEIGAAQDVATINLVRTASAVNVAPQSRKRGAMVVVLNMVVVGEVVHQFFLLEEEEVEVPCAPAIGIAQDVVIINSVKTASAVNAAPQSRRKEAMVGEVVVEEEVEEEVEARAAALVIGTAPLVTTSNSREMTLAGAVALRSQMVVALAAVEAAEAEEEVRAASLVTGTALNAATCNLHVTPHAASVVRQSQREMTDGPAPEAHDEIIEVL